MRIPFQPKNVKSLRKGLTEPCQPGLFQCPFIYSGIIEQWRRSVDCNVTSDGSYIPQVFAPVYSACKAALHHNTIILRHSLSATGCRLAELIPPTVQTGLSSHGVPLQISVTTFSQSFLSRIRKRWVTSRLKNCNLSLAKIAKRAVFE